MNMELGQYQQAAYTVCVTSVLHNEVFFFGSSRQWCMLYGSINFQPPKNRIGQVHNTHNFFVVCQVFFC